MHLLSVSWFRRSVAGLSQWGPGVDLRSVHVRYAMNKVVLGRGFLRALRFSLAKIIPPMLHTHIGLPTWCAYQKDKRVSLVTFEQTSAYFAMYLLHLF